MSSSLMGEVGFWPGTDSLVLFFASLAAMLVAKLVLEKVVFPAVALPPTAFKDGQLDPNLSFFTIHALANAVVCWLAFSDTIRLLAKPMAPYSESESVGHAVVMSVHIFHALFYKLTKADIVHHAASVGLVGSIGWCVPWGGGLHAMDFFICGLPGGVDYAMLAAAKAGLVRKITVKRVAKWLNIACRWPGILLVINAMPVTPLCYTTQHRRDRI